MRKFSQDLSTNKILGGYISILQLKKGFRVGIDSILLASSVNNCSCCLELGSGSGVISVCIAKRIPNIEILGIENNIELVNIANKNVEKNGLSENNIKFLCLDVVGKEFKILHNNYFDQVVMNPPYFSEKSVNPSKNTEIFKARYESKSFLEDWVNIAYKKLIPKGSLNFIFRTESIDRVLAILNPHWGDIRIYPLWPKAGIESKLFLIQAKKDVKTKAKILPGMILHNKNGSYTDACNDVLLNRDLVQMS